MAGVTRPLRVGVVGYGAGGRLFHTPFIEAADGVELAGVVARAPARVAEARADWPGVEVFGSLAEMLDSDVDAVTITTPPGTHFDLAKEAIDAGVHVVVDKPFVPSSAEARELIDLATKAGVLLSVYQNRRWDTDLVTLAGVLEAGRIGRVWRVASRMDQDNAASLRAGRGNGLLLDLGTHLLDQMVWLLGPVATVTAQLHHVALDEGFTDAAFALTLVHCGGAVSSVESTKAHRLAVRELRALGTDGAYSATATDVQELAVKAGLRPAHDPDSWGYERTEHWGSLVTASGEERVPSAQGRWHDFYTRFGAAVRGEAEQPVPADEALHVLQVIESARDSALSGGTVAVRFDPAERTDRRTPFS